MDKFYIFALKFKLLNMENKQLNRIKVVLVDGQHCCCTCHIGTIRIRMVSGRDWEGRLP